MRGNAQPFAVDRNPGVRKSAIMIKGLTLVKTLCVIDSSHYGHVSIEENPLVTICHEAGSVREVFIVSQELGLRHKNTVIVRADEGIGYQPGECFES